jgi:hypothetical protein
VCLVLNSHRIKEGSSDEIWEPADSPLALADKPDLRIRRSTNRRLGVVNTMVDVGSLASSGSQRMDSRMEMSHIWMGG